MVVRDSEDNVNLVRVKVQMDMALANSLNASLANPAGTTKLNYVPQVGKFIDVYNGPNQSLIIIGVTAKGTIWKKELYKGFFDIFNANWKFFEIYRIIYEAEFCSFSFSWLFRS